MYSSPTLALASWAIASVSWETSAPIAWRCDASSVPFRTFDGKFRWLSGSDRQRWRGRCPWAETLLEAESILRRNWLILRQRVAQAQPPSGRSAGLSEGRFQLLGGADLFCDGLERRQVGRRGFALVLL